MDFGREGRRREAHTRAARRDEAGSGQGSAEPRGGAVAEDRGDNPYEGLRAQALAVKADELPARAAPVHGLLMETGHDAAVVTLVALADGTVSLYFSNGGGILGIGGHEKPRRICLELLAGAPHFLPAAAPAATRG